VDRTHNNKLMWEVEFMLHIHPILERWRLSDGACDCNATFLVNREWSKDDECWNHRHEEGNPNEVKEARGSKRKEQ
jgi:hypothetical protein